MTLLHGAIHRPNHPTLSAATQFRVGAPPETRNWFANCPADGEMHLNDLISDCCEVADYQLLRVWKSLDGEDWAIPDELIRLRYEAIAGWNGVTPGNDPGSVVQADCFAWQAAPLLDDKGRAYPATWTVVAPADISAALRHGPLLGTIGLTAANADDPDQWWLAPDGPFTDFHRVLAGRDHGGSFVCRSYGIDYLIHPAAFVGADLMVRG